MRRFLMIVGIFLLSGCLVKTYTIEKPRIDRDIVGNQGHFMGSSKEPKARGNTNLSETRKISVMEFEFGPKSSDRQDSQAVELDASIPVSVDDSELEEVEEIEMSSVEDMAPQFEYYKIQKNDTLQKISQKFYGTTRKWKFLYDSNDDILKSPSKIYPGVTIKIPRIDK
ncbi:MAG: LysM peptidoglycan-binding domain-containing protein [Candidatus Omnitrophica bacterium]|nr:LysM peptidoglycan-binding domain-containing protein [Candidatus Omnitrophota bacterium]